MLCLSGWTTPLDSAVLCLSRVDDPPGHAGLGDVSQASTSGPPEGRLPGQ